METWRRVATTTNGTAYNGEAWEQVGVDHGNGSKPIVLWYRNHDYVVFKIPAGKHWRSLLEPSVSHPGHYHVARLVSDDVVGKRFGTEHLFDMPISTKGKEGVVSHEAS